MALPLLIYQHCISLFAIHNDCITHYNKLRSTHFFVHFAYFVPLKIFYPIGRRCNYAFCVTTSTMVPTYGITIKMLQNTVHCGLILWKVSINDKDDHKTVPKNTTHIVLSLCNYFPHRIHCNERVSVFMHAIQKPTIEKNS